MIDPARHREPVIRTHGRALLLRAGLALAVRPVLALHFARTRLGRYARKLLPGPHEQHPEHPAPAAPHGRLDGAVAVLAHVAVVDRARSFGLGSALVRRFTDDAEDEDCAQVTLVTAADDGGADRYYERLDWRYAGETRTPEGHLFATYAYPLTQGKEL
ncbi:GNAT family N-acetyltransferase [Streptomyces sp. CA-142005]|uniref:GNAT family N-acetyltransferase n=1 Tax=Streptomyces sp. CA-142005 TaxID=3240052 RepID=UPI003D94F8F3